MELRQFFYKTLIVVGTIATLYVLFQVRSILLLFFGAILFASTVRPIARTLSSRGVPPLVSILVIYVGFLASLVGIAVLIVPSILMAFQDLLKSETAIVVGIETVVQRIQNLVLAGAGTQPPLLRASDLLRYIDDIQAASQARVQETLVGGVVVLSEALILFVMALYWFTERDRLEELALKMLRLKHRERFISIFGEIETTLGAFVRGQLILSLTLGVFTFVVLSLLGVRSPLALAVFAALAELIPMVGPIIGAVPAILIALMDSPEKALLVALAFVLIQQIEAQVLVPKVMERQVGLSPLFVLLAITSGNLLGGLGGALIAIPIAAALKIILREFVIAPTVEARKFPVMEDGAVLLDDTSPAPLSPPAPPATEAVPETPPASGPPIVLAK